MHENAPAPDTDIAREERAIYVIVAVALSPVLVGLVLAGGVVDAGGTLSLIAVSLAVVGLCASLRAFSTSRLPSARVHPRPQVRVVRPDRPLDATQRPPR